MPKIVIDIPKDKYNEIMNGDYIPDGNFRRNCIIAIRNGTPLENYCLTQCETGNPCLYCKHEFENKIIDKHIGDKCTADDCDKCKNNYDCISYLEEYKRINSENEIDN